MCNRPNENKMSDGGRGRAWLAVKVWKSSQNVDTERSAVRSIAWLDRWCRPYAMITLPSTKQNICSRAINQNRQRKTHKEGGDVQGSALIKWMRSSTGVVKRNQTLHESVWPKQDFASQLGSSLRGKTGKRRGQRRKKNPDPEPGQNQERSLHDLTRWS